MIFILLFNHLEYLSFFFIIKDQRARVAAKLVGTGNSVVAFEFNIYGKSNPNFYNCAEIFLHNPGFELANIDRTYSPSSPLSAIIYVYNFLGIGFVNPAYKKIG